MILPGLSRLLLCPVLRWLEALLPETKRFASRPLEQAALEGRERDDACRAACGTRQFFLKTDRARARSELGESQRGCRRGLEGGAPWGGSPKQHPPSPPEAKHFEESKGFCQANGALRPHHTARCKGDSPCLPLPRGERINSHPL